MHTRLLSTLKAETLKTLEGNQAKFLENSQLLQRAQTEEGVRQGPPHGVLAEVHAN